MRGTREPRLDGSEGGCLESSPSIPDLSGPEMLRHLLTERGISQASAAREMGMAPSTVSDILRGKRGIGRKHIEAFATYFHVSPAVFLPEP